MLPNVKLSLRQMEYFTAIAEVGSLRGAAMRLGVSQPTLTAQIAALEDALGVALFERTRAGVNPTVAARELLPIAHRIQEEVLDFVDTARGFEGGLAGTYRIGVTPTLGPYLLPQVLPEIHTRFKALRLVVREGVPSELMRDLKGAKHDVIVSTQPITESGLEICPLFREPLRLVIPIDHPLAQKSVISRMDLEGEEVLTIDEKHLFHRQVSELCRTLGAIPRRDFEGTSLDTLRQMVVMGMGVTFLPALYVLSEIRSTDPLRVVDVEGVNMYRDHAMAWRSRSPARPLFRRLAQTIQDLMDTINAEVIALDEPHSGES